LFKKSFLVLLCALCPMLAHAQGRTSNKPIIYLTFDDGPSRDSVRRSQLLVMRLVIIPRAIGD